MAEGSSVSLQGYGAELALKNTEYRTVDDSTASDDNEEATEEEIDPDEVIRGINFHRLIDSHPDLEKSLRELRNNLADSSDDVRQLKRWEMSGMLL